MEWVSIKIHTKQGPIQFISSYKPPKNKLLYSNIIKLIRSPPPVFKGGDFNAAHTSLQSQYTNSAGRHHVPTRINNTLDIALTNISNLPRTNIVTALHSHHLPVVGQIPICPHTKEFSNIKETDIDLPLFVTKLINENSTPISINSSQEIDESALRISNSISKSFHSNVIVNLENFYRKFPAYILKLIKSKNYFRRLYQRSGSSHKKPISTFYPAT